MAQKLDETAVLNALRVVKDPDLHRDIVSLGFVKDVKIRDGKVSFVVELTTPACPVKERLKEESRLAVASLPGVESVFIEMTSQVRQSPGLAKQQLLPGVKNVIPVASGKGGVGKSTVSANLALALARDGARVGLMDADVYGPSIPHIMGIGRDERPMQDERGVIPIERFGVKVISMGFFIREDQAVVWRGPMLGKAVEQFLGGVQWGELDYLIVDLPPGTGDVQLSLCQRIPLTGAAVVSTPQDVAMRVAEKAIIMFRQLNTPVLGLIENMSHYVCKHCGERDDIFSSGGTRRASERLGIPFLGEIPLATAIREAADEGRPTVVSEPDSVLAKAYRSVAESLAAQVSIRSIQGDPAQRIQINF
jgi:ATP-binding protein involved in chromosome partitioning